MMVVFLMGIVFKPCMTLWHDGRFNFLRYTMGQYVRVLVEVMCGCNRGKIPGQSVVRNGPTRAFSRVLPAPRIATAPAVAAVAVAVHAPVVYPSRPPLRIQQSRFPQRGVFQSYSVPVPQYNPETTVWGPSMWKVLHTLAECSDNSPLWFDILNALEIHIPCPTCKAHFIEYRLNNPAPADHQGIVDWFFILHNVVNARLNKPLYDATGLPSGDKAALLASLSPVIQGLSVSFPPEVLALLESMVTSLI